MKKTKILLSMLAVAGLMVMGTSCSDDDDTVVNTQTNTGQTDQTTDTDTGGGDETTGEVEDTGVYYGQDIIGSYTGYTSVSSSFYPSASVTTDETLEITANENGTANITLVTANWGTYEVENAKVTMSGSTYVIEATSGSVTTAGTTGVSGTYDFTLSGTVEDGEVTITAEVSMLNGGTTVVFSTGEIAPAAVVAGSYDGNLEISLRAMVFFTASYSYKTTAELVANNDGTVDITLGGDYVGFNFAGIYTLEGILGDIYVGGASVTANEDGTYSLYVEDFETELHMTGYEDHVDYGYLPLTVTVDGTVDAKGAISLSYSGTFEYEGLGTINFSGEFTQPQPETEPEE